MQIAAWLKSRFRGMNVSAHQDIAGPEPVPTKYATAAERIKATGRFGCDDIDLLRAAFERLNGMPEIPWDDLRNSFFVLPDWFRTGLDPMSKEYFDQQRRLWGVLAGVDRAYDPCVDEETTPPHDDAVRFPAYFIRRDPGAVEEAANHILATGMIMKHGGLKPGQWALEYGAGFAQTALQLARLGVNVDTVDISEHFCQNVRVQADFFNVPLTPFQGHFGWNPRGDQKYDLIWFYESFHHCLDFKNVVDDLKRHLAATGRVLLVGEPIVRREEPAVPYPWGLRLHSEVVAVIRIRHWFELGFTEDFLANLFTSAGFSAGRMECCETIYGGGYVFLHRDERIEMGRQWLPLIESETWHGLDGDGRWTKGESVLTLDATDSFSALEVQATNHHPVAQPVEITYGTINERVTFKPGERKTIVIDATVKAPKLIFRSRTLVPDKDYKKKTTDDRALGIFVREVRYR